MINFAMLVGFPNYLSFLEGDFSTCVAEATHETYFVCGYVHLVAGGGAYLIANNLYFHNISVTLVKTMGLCMGDFIEGQTNGASIVSISHINSKSPNICKHTDFNSAEAIAPHKYTCICSQDVRLGERILVTSPVQERIKCIAKDSCALPTNTYSMALVLDEDEHVIKTLTQSGVRTAYLASPIISLKKQFTLCLFALFHAKHIACHQGTDVILFIDSLTKMMRLYNKLSSPDGKVEPGRMDVAALSDLKTYFSATKTLCKGSLTIVAHTNPPVNDFDKMLCAEFSDLAHVKVSV